MRFNKCAVLAFLITEVLIWINWENPFAAPWFSCTISLVIPALGLMFFWSIPRSMLRRHRRDYTEAQYVYLMSHVKTSSWRWRHRDLTRLVRTMAEYKQKPIPYTLFVAIIEEAERK